ncbi:global nitrogen regulator [Clostridium tepidiprofundi DSM 19306]|uniref:Global nitrogen regulator n=1 Tax=Clostridium tepidiprofundi DSM 19306 TaxID=1121338 RepID=A0A151B593_9CLOT|nr:Crp/Fnr family transcriptional regulator [Clostridium tepidiprofundi]KYH35056.1 global nitrogen regulator [Clostridium tepidiprofundi DSM 19306]
MIIKKYIELLRLGDLFKDFSHEELAELFNERNHRVQKYNKKSIIYFENEKCIFFDIILEGSVVVQKIDEDGNVLTIEEFYSGDSIGGNILFSNSSTYPMSILAKSNVTILHIKKEFVLELCQINKEFLNEFLKCISDKALILTQKIKTISKKSIRESIIDFLNIEYYYQKNRRIELEISKKELAERLGVQRTSLSRELNKMKKDGLILYDKNSITIVDPKIIKKNY